MYVWIYVHVWRLTFHFFFFSLRSVFQCFLVGLVHYSQHLQTSFFNKTFIKNGFHGIIHTFKNYFFIMFLVFNKISNTQTQSVNFLFDICCCHAYFSIMVFFIVERTRRNIERLCWT